VAIVGDAAHAMPPNLGQAANTSFINVLALAAAVDESTDIPRALARWEQRQRPVTDHVQWFSYIYGYIVAKWPVGMQTLRSDLICNVAKTDWFYENLNRGPWHIPDGYKAIA
jgi:2-polyprenyl-6-methoxyphenol hydroxylase-like FAD-dependent oxidoreductase